MTQKISVLTLAVVAAATLAAERAVGRDGNYATAGGHAVGVTNTGGGDGDRIGCDVIGTTIVTAGAAFSDGDFLQVGTDGKLVVQTAGVAVAKAMQDAAADGDRVEVLWIPNAPASMGTAVADSVAADVPTLVANFNSLLAVLRAAGVIAT